MLGLMTKWCVGHIVLLFNTSCNRDGFARAKTKLVVEAVDRHRQSTQNQHWKLWNCTNGLLLTDIECWFVRDYAQQERVGCNRLSTNCTSMVGCIFKEKIETSAACCDTCELLPKWQRCTALTRQNWWGVSSPFFGCLWRMKGLIASCSVLTDLAVAHMRTGKI